APVDDWVPLGSARLAQVGRQLSMALVAGDLAAQIRVGDRVEIYRAGAEPEPPAAPSAAPPDEDLPEVDPATEELLTLWASMSGQWLDARIAGWERYLARRPDSPHAAALREDLAELRRLRDLMRSPDDTLETEALGGIAHRAPSRATAGEAAPLAFLIEDETRLSSAWLHYRRRGEASYKRALLERDGDLYLRGSIPAGAMAAPGVEYFVEVATASGQVGTAVGRPDDPIEIEVERPTVASAFTGAPSRSSVTVRGSYLDFATFDGRSGERTDRFFMTEADFAYRVSRWLSAVRAGFGSVQGEGGFADERYDEMNRPDKVGFNYGYAEIELHPQGSPLGLALRAVSGVGQEGFGLGGEARLRVGDPDGTHVSLGGSRIAELGFLSDLRLQLATIPRAPIGFTVAVTDQPNEGDLGMLFATDVGWRALPWLAPTLRLSYQARTVVHSGLGAGFGLVFGW
ncbi:MAG TPA: hypothetical protein VFU21_00630, partial [Kofleriaceae bacterium]|nr:hypothetical protein [Kofleriaceae bacterium]